MPPPREAYPYRPERLHGKGISPVPERPEVAAVAPPAGRMPDLPVSPVLSGQPCSPVLPVSPVLPGQPCSCSPVLPTPELPVSPVLPPADRRPEAPAVAPALPAAPPAGRSPDLPVSPVWPLAAPPTTTPAAASPAAAAALPAASPVGSSPVQPCLPVQPVQPCSPAAPPAAMATPVAPPETQTLVPEGDLEWDPSGAVLWTPDPSPCRDPRPLGPRLSVSRKGRGHRRGARFPPALLPGSPSLALAGAPGPPAIRHCIVS
ncbi:uncharacterized protein [Paramormyrops kingsleyae]|uniref:uncharacterized protein n=1 Tax=Paramormyrops kingsleyae TaxID=1676925 RepID=UPI003B97A818